MMPVQQYPILSPQQANPLLYGLREGLAAQKQGQDIHATQLANALQKIKLNYADPEEKAALALAQARPGLVQAQTGLANTRQQWLGPTAQANIQQALASAQQAPAT